MNMQCGCVKGAVLLSRHSAAQGVRACAPGALSSAASTPPSPPKQQDTELAAQALAWPAGPHALVGCQPKPRNTALDSSKVRPKGACAIAVQGSSHVDPCRCPAHRNSRGHTAALLHSRGCARTQNVAQQQGSPCRRLAPAALDVLHKVVQEHRPRPRCIIVAQVLVNAPSEVQHLQQSGPAVKLHALQVCHKSASTPAAQHSDKRPATANQACCCQVARFATDQHCSQEGALHGRIMCRQHCSTWRPAMSWSFVAHMTLEVNVCYELLSCNGSMCGTTAQLELYARGCCLHSERE